MGGALPGGSSGIGINSEMGVMILGVGVDICAVSTHVRFAAFPLGCLGLCFLTGSRSLIFSAAACAALRIPHFFEVICGRLLASCNCKSVSVS